jgi:hypothetical protein
MANGNTEPKLVSEGETKNPGSVLNTFIRNHERKKESQRDHQPKENQPAPAETRYSEYARRRDERNSSENYARYGSHAYSGHANTAE